MKPKDLTVDRIYADGHTAVRRLVRVTTTHAGAATYQSAIYDEIAGLNRGRSGSMPLDAFCAFAKRTVKPSSVNEEAATLGLTGYGISGHLRDIITDLASSTGDVNVASDDVTSMEKLVGLGLATRNGPRLKTTSFTLHADIVEAIAEERRRSLSHAA